MYLPESKYSDPKFTNGNKYTLKNGDIYTGWYFIAFTGKAYSGKKPSENSRRLFEMDPHSDLFVGSYLPKFISEYNFPTEKDYEEGVFKRYFVQDRRDKNIIEVKKETYQIYVIQSFVDTVVIDWQLNGPAEDINHGPYIYFGAANQNRQIVKEAEKAIKGLTSFIKYYNQFVK